MSLALFGPGSIGFGELLLILLIVLLLFGSKKLPDLARSLGRSLSEFKKGREEGIKDAAPDASKEPPKPQEPSDKR
jgi:sec-independent protein translocase protein TatA